MGVTRKYIAKSFSGKVKYKMAESQQRVPYLSHELPAATTWGDVLVIHVTANKGKCADVEYMVMCLYHSQVKSIKIDSSLLQHHIKRWILDI